LDSVEDKEKIDMILKKINFKYTKDGQAADQGENPDDKQDGDANNNTDKKTSDNDDEEALLEKDDAVTKKINDINKMLKRLTAEIEDDPDNEGKKRFKKETEDGLLKGEKEVLKDLAGILMFKVINDTIKDKYQVKRQKEKKKEGSADTAENKETEEDEDKPHGCLGWFMHYLFLICETPWKWLCWLTCTPVDEEDWSKNRILCWAIVAPPMIILYITKNVTSWEPYVYVGLPVAVVLFVIFLGCTDKEKAPCWFIIFTIIGTLMGLLYNYILVGILIDFLNAFGMVMALEKTYLG